MGDFFERQQRELERLKAEKVAEAAAVPQQSEEETRRLELIRRKEFKERFANALHTDLLDVQSYQLTAVPKETWNLTNLRRLYLQNNMIEDLPASIGLLSNLTALYLNDNRLPDLPPEFGALKALMTASLHNNLLGYLPREIGLCAKLQVVTLQNNRLEDIPLELGLCSELKNVETRDNPDLKVPPSYVRSQGPARLAEYLLKFGESRRGQRRELDLAKFRLKGFPGEIISCDYLKRLNLSGNAVGVLPYGVCGLTCLTSLKLESCKLSGRLTQGLGELTDLTELDLTSNDVVSVPVGIGNCTDLKRLLLERNWPMRLPPKDVASRGHPAAWEFLARLSRAEVSRHLDLRELRLTNVDFLGAAVGTTRLGEIPEPLDNGCPWTHLVVLDLSQNKVQDLGAVLGEMVCLQSLLCSINSLASMPDGCTRLVGLKTLKLEENRFSEFPSVVCLGDEGGKALKEVTIDADVSGLGIPQTSQVEVWLPGAPAPCLETLDMTSNMLSAVGKPLVYVSTLTSLRLGRNRLSKLPPLFGLLSALTELDVSFNDFGVLSADVWTLTRLTSLNVSTNKLSELPVAIAALRELSHFDMSDNRISALPLQIGQLQKLTRPIFKGNPLAGIPSNLMRGGDKAIFACWRAMCESSRTHRFDVSSTGMVDLPSQISGMTWLEELNLSNNQLVHLSPMACDLFNVRVMNISHNRLGDLPPEIGQLTELRSLDVRGNNIRQLPLELGFCAELRELKVDEAMVVLPSKVVMALEVRAIMIYLRRLHEAGKTGKLSLTGMGLSNVPREVWGMTELQRLDIDKNWVTDIEAELVWFDRLESFSCTANKISNLSFLEGDSRQPPWDKQRLLALTTMRCRGNLIEAIPTEITRLKNLKILQMDNNLLTGLPDDMCYLADLEQLTVSRNVITALPEAMSALKELNTLDVSYNKIAYLPFGLGTLDDLVKFNFNDNPVRCPPLEVIRQGANHTLHYLATCINAGKSEAMDCSSMSLYEVPREVCNITNLRKLKLCDNNIAMLRGELRLIVNLENLDVSENMLRTFPAVLCDLTLLGDLNISMNPITALPAEIGRLTVLRRLGIEGLSLLRPAPEVVKLNAGGIVKYMRKYHRVGQGFTPNLDISKLGLHAYPREITDLGSHLKRLNLDDNNIMDLTEGVGQLYNLEELSAEKNQLFSLSFAFNSLTALVYLNLQRNAIVALPNVPGLGALRQLDIKENQITELPRNIRRWTSLKTLDISNNRLIEVTDGIGDLVRLRTLDLSSNKIPNLPNSMANMSRLATLKMQKNALTFLPPCIVRMTTLQELDVSGNRILSLPPALCTCTLITSLEITWSNLLVPPAETHGGGLKSCFSYLSELYLANEDDSLRLDNWGLQSFPLDGNFLTSITHLDLRSNGIRVLPAMICLYQNLRSIQLDENFFESLPEQLCLLHNSLVELSCSRCELMKLPHKIHQLTALVRLQLSHNSLTSIPDSFSSLTMLRYLDLDFNKVAAIPIAIGKLTRLQELCLEDNPIREVSRASLAGCRNLRTLRVTIDHFDDLQFWRKDTQTYSLISGHGVHMPPSEVILRGSECIFKYLQLVSSSKISKELVLSRVQFWMLEMQDASQRFYTWPEELSNYDHLQGLNLAGNFLLTVPPSVSNLTNLKQLDLEQNRLRKLPTELSLCANLELIMLLRNPDLKVPSREVTSKGSAAVIQFLRCLHSAAIWGTINFNDASYRRIPIELLRYDTVTELSVARNAIEIIPAEIQDMVSMTSLDLDSNQIAMLPEEVCSLTNLERLGLADNILVALPDEMTQLLQLSVLRTDGNFLVNAPPEIVKQGTWCVLEFHLEVKWGRMSGTMDLSSFELLAFPPQLPFNDKPARWNRGGIDRYVRVFAEELNRRRKRLTEEMAEQLRRNEREAQGLDPDHISEFSESDASWNALEEFCDDAVIEQGIASARRPDLLMTLDLIMKSFTLWYAFALGYNGVDEMEASRETDEDVRKMPSDIDVFDYIVARFGPPELEAPCRWCIELGKDCVELGTGDGPKKTHKGRMKAARSGWYNIKVRKDHGPDARWDDEDANAASDGPLSEDERADGDDFDKFLKQGAAEAAIPTVDKKLDGDSDASSGWKSDSGDSMDKFDGEGAAEKRAAKLAKDVVDPRTLKEDLDTLTNILSGAAFAHVRSIDLHNNLITVLPGAVSNLVWVKHLRLSYNLLTVLPGEVGCMIRLEYLNLAGNRVANLPHEMSALQDLKTLDIRKNEFQKLPDALMYFTSLTKLSAQHNHLVTISSVLGECKVLEELWLQANRLTSIHPLIGGLACLRVLNLGENNVSSIPPHVGNCVALRHLGLYGNGLARLPPSLKKLKHLESLMVNNNALLEVPELLMFLRKLEVLHLNANQFTVLGESIAKVGTLTKLHAQNNRLAEIPPEVADLSNLTELRLDGNELLEVMPEIGLLSDLRLLVLTSNQLQTVPKELGALTALTKLSLDFNRMTFLPEGFGGMASLQRLWLDNNKLRELPEDMGDLTSLIELHIDHNSMNKLCTSFANLTNLIELFAHNNEFGMSRPGPQGTLDRLPPLGIPVEIFHIINLRALTLSENSLEAKDLPDDLSKLTNLTELWLQDNRFDELPSSVCKLPNLRYMLLDVAMNTIRPLSNFYDFKGRDDKVLTHEDKALRAMQNARSAQSAKKGQLDKLMRRAGAY